MPNKDNTLIDKDGVVHEKGWDGQYRPKQGFLGTQKDQTWIGEANTEHDSMGQQKKATGTFGQQMRSIGGNVLYRRGASGDEATVILILIMFIYAIIIGLVIALSGVIIVATPLIAPALLIFARKERTKGNLAEYKKWNNWGIAASVIAIFAVMAIAGIVGTSLYSTVISTVKIIISDSTSSIVITLVQVLALVISFGGVILSFITGMAPTAIVYLHYEGTKLQARVKSLTSDRLRYLKWGIGIVAMITVCLAIARYIAMMIIGLMQ